MSAAGTPSGGVTDSGGPWQAGHPFTTDRVADVQGAPRGSRKAQRGPSVNGGEIGQRRAVRKKARDRDTEQGLELFGTSSNKPGITTASFSGLTRGSTAHGFRKAAARRLAEAGVSTKHIMSVTDHTTLKEIERYTRDADQAQMANAAFEAMARRKQEQKLPNPEKRLG